MWSYTLVLIAIATFYLRCEIKGKSRMVTLCTYDSDYDGAVSQGEEQATCHWKLTHTQETPCSIINRANETCKYVTRMIAASVHT